MRLTKAILRPIRAAFRGGGSVSLSFFTRRPRTNPSSGQASSSISAPVAGKKRGCRFDNPEPSSPKVTCIGQVRVKSKRRAKQCRSLTGGRPIGEVSFRKAEHITTHADHHGDQKGVSHRWVHLPISVCDALRASAAEFSCLFPCRRRGCSTTGGKNADENGCGAVVWRWLVSVNCGGGVGGKRREIEVVLTGGGDTEVDDGNIITATAKGEDEEGIASRRVSICITQENALMLMRCRSDPTKMAALTTEFDNDEEENHDGENAEIDGGVEENEEETNDLDMEADDDKEDSESNMSSFEALLDQENTETHEKSVADDNEEVIISDKDTTNFDKEAGNTQELVVVKKEQVLPECLLLMMCEPKLSMEVSKETWVCSTDFVRRAPERPLKAAKVAAGGGGCCHHSAVKRRHLVVESKPTKPSVPVPPSKKNDGLQPARSSCSLPASASMAAVIEQKLLANGGVAYEPFALTRCKSEPMRTAAAKVMPESCLWNNGVVKQEQLGAGAGAAGVGF